MKKTIISVVLIAGLLVAVCDVAWAATYYEDSTYKLGRGMTNVVTCLFELGNSIEIEIQDNGICRGVIFGMLKGMVRTVFRLGAGVYEVLTFPVELPEDYQPLLEPEFVFVPET